MSIRQAVYDLCKGIKQSAHRSDVAELILSLRFSDHSQGGTDRSRLNLYAREQRLQTLGYLIADQREKRLEQEKQLPCSTLSLEEEERNLLMGVHQETINLNRRCVEWLVKAIPQAILAVDPYNRSLLQEFKSVDMPQLLNPELADSVVSEFHRHPGIDEALSTLEQLGEEMDEDHYASDVIDSENYILENGPLSSPKEFVELRKNRPDTPRKTHNRHMSAILCVRDSLYNLNQLIFQAILTDRLVVFDEESIIDMGPGIQHSSGMGIGLVFQPASLSLFDYLMIDKKTIVLLKSGRGGLEKNLLLRIESVHEEFSGTYGNICLVELRDIDENLNSFYGILH